MANQNTTWVYDTSMCSMDKRVSRVCVKRPAASELIGFDGNSEGGLRPHYGFLTARELIFGSVDPTNHDGTSVVLDLFPLNMKVGSGYYAYGFIYRVQRKTSGTTADVFIEVWDSLSEDWQCQLIAANVSMTEPMSVSTLGRFTFTFIGGVDPLMTFLDDGGDGSIDPPVITSLTAGVGLQPSFVAEESSGTWGSLNTVGVLSPRYGAAQVILTTVAPSAITAGTPLGSAGAWTGQLDTQVRALDPGDYSFAYMLFNSKTGRRSTLSDIAFVRTADFGTTPNAKFGVVELVWNSDYYDTAYFYRSVRVQSAGGTFTAAILQLDSIQTLDDLEIVSDPATVSPLKHGIYYYKLEDKQLVFQEAFTDRSLSDMTAPKGSSSCVYENTIIVGNVNDTTPSTTEGLRESDLFSGLGEIRWSSLQYSSPEVFPPGNRYVPEVPSNAALCFRNCGGNVIGFGNDRMFFIRKDAGYIRVQEMHEGYGIIGPHAGDTVGSLIYFLTSKGLKSVDSDGALDDVRSLNRLIMEEWFIGDLPAASVAFDPRTSALYILNPAEGEAAVLWFNTGKVTQLRDLPFDRVVRGVWPQFNEDTTNNYGGTLQERAFFLQNFPLDGHNDATDAATWKPHVYVLDERRLKYSTTSLAKDRVALLDTKEGTSNYIETGTSYTTGSFQLTSVLSSDDNGNTTAISTDDQRWTGCWIYVMESTATSLIGAKAKVKRVDATGYIVLYNDDETDPFIGLPDGSILGVSPVFCRWVGYPAGVQVDTDEGAQVYGQSMDFFKDRTASSIGCYFTSVHRYVKTYLNRFAAGVYTGGNEEPSSLCYSRTRAGTFSVETVVEGESGNYVAVGDDFDTAAGTAKRGVKANALTPMVETWVPDLDYRLVAVAMRGAVADTARTNLST